jgi:glycosyltransferase involved in cell wall biosynthesis
MRIAGKNPSNPQKTEDRSKDGRGQGMFGQVGQSAAQQLQRPIYLDAASLAAPHLTGIGRYTARLALALASRSRLHFFDGDQEIKPRAGLSFHQDQDLAVWAKRVWRGKRFPFDPEDNAVGIYTCLRPNSRSFSVEASVLHDLTPLLIPETHIARTIRDYQKFFATSLLNSDFALSDSHATRADAAWLCDFPESAIHVAHAGPSLCVQEHLNNGPAVRRAEVGLVVSTLEPRKNARFLIDWFAKSDIIAPGSELWWVGANGWKMSRRELQKIRMPNGRRFCFLGAVDDPTLCRLYKTAGWMVVPSLYEGFGFPALDALRHGLPVLASGNSSLREFAGPGVSLFDPIDPRSLDSAYLAMLQGKAGLPPTLNALNARFDWNRVIDIFFEALAKCEQTRIKPKSDTRAA